MARKRRISAASVSSSPSADEAPWLATYTASTGNAARRRCSTSARNVVQTLALAGPPGGAPITISGAGVQLPNWFMRS
ncbi:hypothetical protein D3C72_1059410 [compost metagenome]